MSDDHLNPEPSNRGFNFYPPEHGSYGGSIEVYESSAAEAPFLWVRVEELDDLCGPKDGPKHEATIHLTAEDAWRLADQLRHLVAHHHHGDCTPGWAGSDQ